MHKSITAVSAAVVGLTAALVLAGCSPTDAEIGGTAVEGENPEFDGPWAREFAEAYAASDSEFVRDILRDGEVTAAELLEANARERECIEEVGVELRWEDPEGWNNSMSIQRQLTPEEDEAMWACRDQFTGSRNYDYSVGFLHFSMQDDPNNSWEADTVQCFIRHGFAEPGFNINDLWMILDGPCSTRVPLTAAQLTNSDCWLVAEPLGDRDRSAAWDEIICRPGIMGETGAGGGGFMIDGEMWVVVENPEKESPPGTFPGGQSADDPQVALCLTSPVS